MTSNRPYIQYMAYPKGFKNGIFSRCYEFVQIKSPDAMKIDIVNVSVRVFLVNNDRTGWNWELSALSWK